MRDEGAETLAGTAFGFPVVHAGDVLEILAHRPAADVTGNKRRPGSIIGDDGGGIENRIGGGIVGRLDFQPGSIARASGPIVETVSAAAGGIDVEAIGPGEGHERIHVGVVKPVAAVIIRHAEGLAFGVGAPADPVARLDRRHGKSEIHEGPCRRKAGGTGADDIRR